MTHRTARVSELLRREVATIIERDFEWNGLLVTVHGVETAADLKNATIHVGVLGGDDNQKAAVLDRLNRARGAIQRPLYKRVTLKSSPQLYFKFDNSSERGVHMVNIIEGLPPVATNTEEPVGKFKGNDGLDHRWEEGQEKPKE
jgi:ribosome-binding factor A